jgi:hypothetical protein
MMDMLGFLSLAYLSLQLQTHSQLDNSSYLRQSNPALYGFWGLGGGFIQMYPADTINNLPAILVNVTDVGHGNPPQQIVRTITDSNYQPISEMVTAWDMAFDGQGMIVTTGTVNPVLYRCAGTTSMQHYFICNKAYSDTKLVTQYRIMRLLGANSTTLYFVGMDIAKGNIDIFSMSL